MTLDTDLACCDARRGAGRSVSGGNDAMRDRAVELAEKFSESARASAGLATTGPSRG
eukprot:CAMPEP_0203002596 /NCGR_PEP_ID=MMETSP1401-20130829/1333_1 /ASSEMBLY_ACC=CAM_ASM_000894 /TAXON_ID=38833 /ORGANISM="Micromonas pusilla, Strain CCAC1681" /LENGTH=56 /DNA_ID=CAMNT_0049744137 /DNA_START=18 /DNA_END=184 /DNA_ORIENTATION=-